MGEPAAGPLVLVADDERAVRELVCEVLADAGYRTVAAADGEEALGLALEHRPDLIVLDLMMPRMDGYTVMARLQGQPLTARIPIVVLTGQSGPLYRSLSAGVGAVAHLSKPCSPRELTETVRKALEAHDP